MAKAKIRGLDCSAPAEKMIPVVLSAQVRAMCRHRDQALNWRDPEGVHDMRVLSRRLRSTINDFRPFFRKGSVQRPKLRKIADMLGDVRDEDVALMALEELASQAKGKAAEGIKLISAQRRLRRAKARAALRNSFKQRDVEQFQKEFLAKLRTLVIAVPGSRQRTAVTVLSFRGLGVRVIKQRIKDFGAASRCLYLPYEVKDHHELRILAKRLRYSMELFASCFGEEMIKGAKEVAQMQTSLGELHDCDIWIGDFGAWLKRLSRKAGLEPEELKMRAGALWLLKHFTRERMEHYRDALARWEQWQADGFLEEITRSLDAETSKPEIEAAPASTPG